MAAGWEDAEVTEMKCFMCKGDLEQARKTYVATLENCVIVIKDVPALVCTQCGEASYADAIGKEISIDDLYAIVARLNDWYAAHSYLTCRAYLPPQTIHAGAVHIALIEGKNGDVTVTGNRSTSSGYIKDRLAVAPGEIERMSDLQHRLD